MIVLIAQTINKINTDLQSGRVVTVSISPDAAINQNERIKISVMVDAVTTSPFEISYHRGSLINKPAAGTGKREGRLAIRHYAVDNFGTGFYGAGYGARYL